jgi:hypothetical protein
VRRCILRGERGGRHARGVGRAGWGGPLAGAEQQSGGDAVSMFHAGATGCCVDSVRAGSGSRYIPEIDTKVLLVGVVSGGGCGAGHAGGVVAVAGVGVEGFWGDVDAWGGLAREGGKVEGGGGASCCGCWGGAEKSCCFECGGGGVWVGGRGLGCVGRVGVVWRWGEVLGGEEGGGRRVIGEGCCDWGVGGRWCAR